MADQLRHDDLTIPQGTDYKVQWPLRDGDGNPLVSMTGWTARAQARLRLEDTDTVAEWTTENDGILLADSTLTLVVADTESTDWEWRRARYDIELVTPTGDVTRLTEGYITVAPEVTR